jgi:transposase
MQEQGLGRSKGGFSSKLDAACDALGNPARFFLTAGQRSDDIKALDLLEGRKMEALIADKGYDADYRVNAAKNAGADSVMFYKERNLMERMFNKLKHFRRVSTRDDKLDSAYLGFVFIEAIYLWLK